MHQGNCETLEGQAKSVKLDVTDGHGIWQRYESVEVHYQYMMIVKDGK